MIKLSKRLVICVALACEARPFIDRYRLKKETKSRVFSVYLHKELALVLIVTGIGRLKMAAAVSYIHQYLSLTSDSYYINIGIAGSGMLSLGDLIIAEKIKDQSTGRTYFPFVADQPFSQLNLVTSYDKPVSDYPEQGVVDMEAAAFFVSAGLFVSQEQLLCLKVVSDTPLISSALLDKHRVIHLINDKMTVIDGRIHYFLSKISDETVSANTSEESFVSLLGRWHFSEYQKNHLKHLLRRWHVLIAEESPFSFCYHARDAQQVLALMMQRLAALDYRW